MNESECISLHACILIYTGQHQIAVIKSKLSLHFNCSHRLSHTVCEIYRPIVYEVYHNYYTAGKNHRNTVIPITIISIYYYIDIPVASQYNWRFSCIFNETSSDKRCKIVFGLRDGCDSFIPSYNTRWGLCMGDFPLYVIRRL